MRYLLTALFFFAAAWAASAQQTVLQGGTWTPGHAPMYAVGGGSQPVVVDSGPALGGDKGVGLSELALAARGTGLPPYVAQGTGPLGTNLCNYDGPINSAAGYHYLCMSPNAQGGGLIAYGHAGLASPLPLQFSVNGTLITGVTCTGAPSSDFATINGIVTHC